MCLQQASKAPPQPTAEEGFEQADLSQPLRFAGRAWAVELDNSTGAIVGLQAQPPAWAAVDEAGADTAEAAAAKAKVKAAAGAETGADEGEEVLVGTQRVELSVHSRQLSMAGAGRGRDSAVLSARREGDRGEEAGLATWEHPLAQVMYSTYAGVSARDSICVCGWIGGWVSVSTWVKV